MSTLGIELNLHHGNKTCIDTVGVLALVWAILTRLVTFRQTLLLVISYL